MRMNNLWKLVFGVAVIAGGALYAMRGAEQPQNTAPGPGKALAAVSLPTKLSPAASLGKVAFEAKCASCHGENAAGQDGMAPPLVHKIYEPSHHADESFQRAAAFGVRAHHWPFGDMPPVEGVTRQDVDTIIAYVRELQRFNGIN